MFFLLKLILGEPEKCVERCRTSYDSHNVPNSDPNSPGGVNFTGVTSIDECRQICLNVGAVAFGLECPQSDSNGENFSVQCFCYNQAAWDGFPGETDLPIEDCMGTPSNNMVQTYHGYQGTNAHCNGPYLENGGGLGGACRNIIRLTC